MIEICNKIKLNENLIKMKYFLIILNWVSVKLIQRMMELVTTAIFESNFSLRWKEEDGEGEKKEEIRKRMKLHSEIIGFSRSLFSPSLYSNNECLVRCVIIIVLNELNFVQMNGRRAPSSTKHLYPDIN